MRKFVVLFVMLMIFFCPHTFAENYLQIDGEELYNQTTEQIMDGSFSLSPQKLLNDGISLLFKEIRDGRGEMLSLLVIAAMSALLQIFKDSGKEINETAFFACYVLMTMSAIRIFASVAGYGAEVIEGMCEFVTKLAPVFTALLAACGKTASASAFHPVLSAAVYVMSLLVDKCILPMVYFSAVLSIVGHITPGLRISSFISLIHSAAKWILMSSLTVFTGVTAIYGFSVPVFDAVALKGIKFAVGTLVPVVGGILSETVDTVLASTGLMKGAVGSAGIIALLGTCVIPVIKIFAIYVMLRVTAAASEPVTDRRMADMLSGMASSVALILGMVVTASTLFVICIAIMLGAT